MAFQSRSERLAGAKPFEPRHQGPSGVASKAETRDEEGYTPVPKAPSVQPPAGENAKTASYTTPRCKASTNRKSPHDLEGRLNAFRLSKLAHI